MDPQDTEPIRYTTTDAAARATRWRRIVSSGAAEVTATTVRSWAFRGHLPVAGLDEHGHPLYDHDDLVHAEFTTRHRALRLVGISAP